MSASHFTEINNQPRNLRDVSPLPQSFHDLGNHSLIQLKSLNLRTMQGNGIRTHTILIMQKAKTPNEKLFICQLFKWFAKYKIKCCLPIWQGKRVESGFPVSQAQNQDRP